MSDTELGDSPASATKAMGLMVIAVLLLPCIDAISKWLSGAVSPGQIAWCRFFIQSMLLLPLLYWHRSGPPALSTHALRGLFLAIATLCFFTAVGYLPLADAIAIFFIEPLVVTLLSPFVLGETVGWRRLSAVTVGFCGALLVIQPSFTIFGWPAVLPIISALTFAGYILLTRHAALRESPVQMQFWAGFFGCALLSPALLIGDGLSLTLLALRWPTPEQLQLLLLMGLIATVGHLFVVYALRSGAVGMLAPFQYLEIVSATALGYWVFSNLPTNTTWLGIAIIVASGLYVFHREHVVRRRARC